MATSTYSLALGRERALYAYRQMSIETASPGELVLMLYNEVMKTMRDAITLIDQHDVAGSSRCLLKAQDIIDELRHSLDASAGGDLAEKLSVVYEYVHSKLVEANVKKASLPVLEALRVIGELRAGWQEVLGKNG